MLNVNLQISDSKLKICMIDGIELADNEWPDLSVSVIPFFNKYLI